MTNRKRIPVDTPRDRQVLDRGISAGVDENPMIPDTRSALEISTEVRNERAATETGQESCRARHATRIRINRDCAIVLTRVRQIGQIQQDQWFGFSLRRELESKERRVVSNCHIHLDPGGHGQSKIARCRRDRVIQVGRLPLFLGIRAAIDVVVVAGRIGEKGEISQRRLATGTGIVKTGKSGDSAAIVGESALVALRIGIGHGFCHAIRDRRACKDIA